MKFRFWSAALAVVLAILILAPAAAADEKTRSDTVWVSTFNQQLVDIDSRTVTADFTFPPEGGQWGEILCYMTIACPESPGDCDPWGSGGGTAAALSVLLTFSAFSATAMITTTC